MKMGKAQTMTGTPPQSRQQGRKEPAGRAVEASTTGKALKHVRHMIEKGSSGNGKKTSATERKAGRKKRRHSVAAASPESVERSKSSKGLSDSGEIEKTDALRSVDSVYTGLPPAADHVKRKRTASASSRPQRKVPGELSRREKKAREKRGVIYIGHMPVGFLEPQLKAFFSQFGEVCRVRLFRSRKNAHSKGYAFVEFALREVAEIAAQAMDKYRMFGRTLVCRLMDKGQVREHVFSKCHKPFKRINWHSRAAAQHNKPDGQRPSAKAISAVERRMKKKAKLLHEAGIDVELPALGERERAAGHLSKWVIHESQEKRNARKAKLALKRKARSAAPAPA